MSKSQGNPEIGMSGDSFESEDAQQTGSKDFFNELDNQVNGGIQDTEVTRSSASGPEQVTHSTNTDIGSNNVAQSNNGTDWKKRYTDSSREAVKWRDQYKQVEQFVPVLDAMKKDSGLVDHVRDYLQGGGKPVKTVQEQLGLDEDFVFDQSEAMSDPESDSAKLMNAHVDKMVQSRVGQMISQEKNRSQALSRAAQRKQDEFAFMKKNGMDEGSFASFKERAKQHTMTLDDVNYILNRDQQNAKVADSTKQDMLKQMKNVRNMPTSASGVNSQGEAKSTERSAFDQILGQDDSVDNLFG
tara:strand:+ start:12400 stop:13296 length:897 start_codon:yes stop_codon:yes gene_type:complete